MAPSSLPEPACGMVVRLTYRWIGQSPTSKERPVCIALVTEVPDPRDIQKRGTAPILQRVVYLPITTKPLQQDRVGLDIPVRVLRHLGLREEPTWIVVSECNIQFWPNDLVPASRNPTKWLHGFIPPMLYDRIRNVFAREAAKRKVAAPKVLYLPSRQIPEVLKKR